MKTPKFEFAVLRFFVVVVLAIGIFFRFYHLDNKVYWIDEVHTSLRVAGYKKTKFDDKVNSSQPITIDELQAFQTLSPQTGWGETFDALAGNAEHAPIYYFLTRLWMQWFGSSAAVTRSVAAVISLLAFPAIYCLSLELFASPLVGWIAMSLVAVSPLHLLYAQEARQYSLWTVTTLVSSLALMRSLRINTRRSWAIYAATVVLGFYSHLISGLVFFGHGLYVLFLEGCRWTKRLKYYLLASFAGFIALIPWIVIYFNNESSIGVWMAREIPLGNLIKRWGLNLSAVFFDLHIFYPRRLFDVEAGQDLTQFGWGNLWIYTILAIALLVGYAIYFTCRTTSQRVWLFLLTIIAANGLFLMLYDVISGGQRSGIARYLFPAYLAIQLAVAYLFASGIEIPQPRRVGLSEPSLPTRGKKIEILPVKFGIKPVLWKVLYVILITGGIISCAVSAEAESWWNKYSCYYNAEVAQIINQGENPLVIGSSDRVSRMTSLSYKLDAKVRLLILEDSDRAVITENFGDIFLFRPSLELYQKIEANPNYQLKPLHPFGHIWQVEK